MQKVIVADNEFQFDKLETGIFKRGAAAFRVVDKDGDESFWVNVPASKEAFDDEIVSPKDGVLTAICHSEEAALVVASSINIAYEVAYAKQRASDIDKLANILGFDNAKLRAEVKRLKEEGKSLDEVSEILKERSDEFLTDEGRELHEALKGALKDAKQQKERSEW